MAHGKGGAGARPELKRARFQDMRKRVPASSERFKDEIKLMDKASEAILALKPVTFRYKHELDSAGTPQFGLVAEEVEKR